MNAVFMMAYNNAAMTKEAIESVFAQTIPCHLVVVDNGSVDETPDMLRNIVCPAPHKFSFERNRENIAPTKVANYHLENLFDSHSYVLCCANDVVLPLTFYEEMLKYPRGIVAASEIKDRPVYDEYTKTMPPVVAVSENTHMAVMLLRKWCYEAVMAKDGYFMDERYFNYCSDCDLALRVSACGIRGVQTNLPFWHFGSASHRLAPQEDGDKMRQGAEADRQRFFERWGFRVFDPQYSACATDLNFKG